jgi:dephospho-CoA kinase
VKFKAILIVGMPGSGKDEFADVARSMKVEVVNMGDIVREYTREMGLDVSQSGLVASQEREKNGKDIWAKRTLEKIRTSFVVIEGIRNEEEIARFRKEADIGLVVGIGSGRKNRFERMVKRGRGDDPTTMEEFETRENRELSWGIGRVLATSDSYICNDGPIDEFRIKVRQFLSEHIVQQNS